MGGVGFFKLLNFIDNVSIYESVGVTWIVYCESRFVENGWKKRAGEKRTVC